MQDQYHCRDLILDDQGKLGEILDIYPDATDPGHLHCHYRLVRHPHSIWTGRVDNLVLYRRAQPVDSNVPTQSQIKALGLLMLTYRVEHLQIPVVEMEELCEMRLCHVVQKRWLGVLRYDISSRLLREWGPYQKLSRAMHDCRRNLERFPTMTLKPDHTMEVAQDAAPTLALMDQLVLEAGRNLAVKWQMWKMEDRCV